RGLARPTASRTVASRRTVGRGMMGGSMVTYTHRSGLNGAHVVSSLILGTEPVELAPGVFHLPRVLPQQCQRELAARCVALIDGPFPAYVPVVRGGGRMHVRMLCLGRHWNGRTYQYEDRRSDFDQALAPELPQDFAVLAVDLAGRVSMQIAPDICIVNYYG